MELVPADLTAFAVIVAAVAVLGILAVWLKQPTIVAYIVSGIVIGPAVLGWVEPTALIESMGELGLAFLLFLIGLELNVREVKHMLDAILLISLPQMVLTAALGSLVAWWLGFSIVVAVLIGLAVMYSSTAVVVKLLTDTDENTVTSGKLDIGILLVQDVVVVILMAMLTVTAVSIQEFALNTVVILGVLLFISVVAVGSGRSLLPSLFRHMAENPHYLFVSGLAWCFLFISLAEYAQLSAEIGAFLAGLGLAQMPYSMELRERVRPLTAFFMAMFFIDFGLGLTLAEVTYYWKEALIAAGVLMVGKFVIIFSLVRWQQYTLRTSFKAGINMTQTSEFSLIFGAVAFSSPVVLEFAPYIAENSAELMGFLTIVALTTMGLSSYLLMYNRQITDRVQPYLETVLGEQRKSDVEQQQFSDHAVVIGYDDVSKIILPLIAENYETVVVVDRDPDTAQALEDAPHVHIFGDFHHRELREEAHIGEAAAVFSVSEEYDVNTEILAEAENADICIVSAVTAEDRDRLYERGADHVLLEHELAGKTLASYIETALEQEVTQDG